MNEVLNAITSFPGIIPSIILAVVIVFGLLAIAGFLDLHHVGPDWGFDLHHGIDLHHDAHDAPEILVALGFKRMPFIVVVSSIGFVWWVLTMVTQLYLVPLIPLPNSITGSWITGLLVLSIAFLVALPIAAMMIRPLKPIFADRGEGTRPIDFVGRACKIVTGSVDEKFGQAEVVVDAGAHHVLQVSARMPNSLVRGSTALILQYDAEKKRFEVESYDP